MPETTPMLKQYDQIKAQHPDCILFFRMGDFYEMMGQDAVEASKILEIALTARSKGTPNERALAGIPYHAIDNYLTKMTKAGKKVAICEQVSDPKLPGIVKREVIRVVTPGTTLETGVLDQKQNNYIVSLTFKKGIFGIALADLSTGEFKVTEISSIQEFKNQILNINPTEVIVEKDLFKNPKLQTFWQDLSNVNVYQLSVWQKSYEILTEHFKTKNLQGFGIENMEQAIESAGLLLNYLQETQKTSLQHINKIQYYNHQDYMILDEATIRNLELLFNSYDGSKQGSLLYVLDQTQTSMGGRLLRNWILQPLINIKSIEQRLCSVDETYKNVEILKDLRTELKNIYDVERLIAKVGCSRANARDLIALKNSLISINTLKIKILDSNLEYFKDIVTDLQDNQEIIELLKQTIIEEPPLTITEGGIIKKGYNKELDDLLDISHSGKDYINKLQVKEIKRTGINSLKIKFNKVFGYYIEISKANLDYAPDDYIRKQTLVNAERFITPELKEYEEKVLGAEDKIKDLEYKIFNEIREKLVKFIQQIQKNSQIIAKIDVLTNFSWIALQNEYTKPEFTDQNELLINNGRHAVIEKLNTEEQYVPNDLNINHAEIVLLTGPNMSGKSSFLRQTALIVLMAHIGSFVPAEQAKIGLTDRIFTRVGASDNLVKGQSTFMVEMQETANILNNATSKSLLIIDELGRGTSTYDGVSIAWSIIEHIHNQIQAKTLFATHYHELIDVIDKLDNAKNFSVAVSEDGGKVVFLRKVVQGGVNKSYGVEVAKLAGLPKDVINRSEEILTSLEDDKQLQVIRNPLQESLFIPTQPKESEIEQQIKKIDVNNLTPIEALQLLYKLKNNLK